MLECCGKWLGDHLVYPCHMVEKKENGRHIERPQLKFLQRHRS